MISPTDLEHRAELRFRRKLAWQNDARIKELETILGQRCDHCFAKLGDAHAPDCARDAQDPGHTWGGPRCG